MQFIYQTFHCIKKCIRDTIAVDNFRHYIVTYA